MPGAAYLHTNRFKRYWDLHYPGDKDAVIQGTAAPALSIPAAPTVAETPARAATAARTGIIRSPISRPAPRPGGSRSPWKPHLTSVAATAAAVAPVSRALAPRPKENHLPPQAPVGAAPKQEPVAAAPVASKQEPAATVAPVPDQSALILELRAAAEAIQRERDFYYSKLREIDNICSTAEQTPTIASVRAILYVSAVLLTRSRD
jgi:hypothetical protein